MHDRVMLLEAPCAGTPCLDEGPPFVLLLAPGDTPIPQALESGVAALEQNPELCAVLDGGRESGERRTFLDLILNPERLASLLVRRNVLDTCRHCLVLNGPLARATTAVRLALGLPVCWAPAPLVGRTRNPQPAAVPDVRAFTREASRSFAIEDLYASLRTSPNFASICSSLLDYAWKLLAKGYRAEGFAMGAWAEALLEGRDSGLGPGLGLPRRDERVHRWSPRTGPLVSIVIPTFRRLDLLPRAIASVANQSCQDIEVVVVNDGGPCPDAVVVPFRAGIGHGLTLVQHEKNRGLAAARNTGIRVARGRYLGLLDDDDLLLPQHVDALLLPLLLGARAAHADARAMIEVAGSPLPRSSALRGYYQSEYDRALYPVDNCLPVQALLCERELILEAGGFDEDLPVLEDWDLWLRIFSIAPPAHVRRITSEVRIPASGAHMTQTRQSCWSGTRAEIYGRTLDLEGRDPTLRRRRVEYLMGVESRSEAPFPREARRWLRGNGTDRIDPDDPLGSLRAMPG